MLTRGFSHVSTCCACCARPADLADAYLADVGLEELAATPAESEQARGAGWGAGCCRRGAAGGLNEGPVSSRQLVLAVGADLGATDGWHATCRGPAAPSSGARRPAPAAAAARQASRPAPASARRSAACWRGMRREAALRGGWCQDTAAGLCRRLRAPARSNPTAAAQAAARLWGCIAQHASPSVQCMHAICVPLRVCLSVALDLFCK